MVGPFRLIALSTYCDYCSGEGDVKCKYYYHCAEIMPYGFMIPKKKEKIKKFIEDYKSGKVLFEIAQDIWEAKEPEEIREKAERCKNKIKVFPGTDLFSMKLSEVSNYMDKRLKKLEEMMKSL